MKYKKYKNMMDHLIVLLANLIKSGDFGAGQPILLITQGLTVCNRIAFPLSYYDVFHSIVPLCDQRS